ncbi:MAG: phosphatidate cytidylyltransferase [Betaproteobacteria bacterium]|nr:phosphatidate cytidylyltransferase [Betaproteobacteria bacterium]
MPWQRVITAAVAVLLFVSAAFSLGNLLWAALLLVPVAVGGWEWAGLGGFPLRARWTFCAAVLASCLVLLAAPPFFEREIYFASAAFWLALAPCWLAWKWRPPGKWLLAAAGWVLLVPTWLALARLQMQPAFLTALVAVIWVSDSAAYVTGRAFGRHRLAPAISPGKTWEGVVGALAAVSVYYGLLWFIFMPTQTAAQALAGWLLASGMTALGIEGALFESWMKRVAGVKDSGNVMPGHGGILDRIDGLTASMPLAALCADTVRILR